MAYGQKYFDLDLSGNYESLNKNYILQLMKVNPSSYYYEFLPINKSDSVSNSNLNCGIFIGTIENGLFNTGYTISFQSGFDFRFSNDKSIKVDINKFSYDNSYSPLTGNYTKSTDTTVPIPHYELFYNKEKFQMYKGAISSKVLFLCYFPMSSDKSKKIKINRKSRLKLLATVFNFALGDMSQQYYYVELTNGKEVEFGWLDYRDLKYFKFLSKT
jgi:hypothetical protein